MKRQKSGEGTTHVIGSVIYQAKRDNSPLLTSGVISSDTRIRAVKNLTMFNLRDAQNTHQKLKMLQKSQGERVVLSSKTNYINGQGFDFLQIMPPKSYTD